MFPDSDRVHYETNPLVEVVCQLRFSKILAISVDEPARFQDLVRQQYPVYELERPAVPANMPAQLQEVAAKLSGDITHRFVSENHDRLLTLSPGFIAVSDQDYVRWEAFRAQIENAQQVLEEIYSPPFYTRIGLRYRNALVPEDLGLEEANWAEMLDSAVAGPLASREIADCIEEAVSRVKIKVDAVDGAYASLTHGLGTLNRDGAEIPAYLIDSDFSLEGRTGGNDVLSVLDEFTRQNGRLFRWAIGRRVHEVLRPSQLGPE